MPSHTKAERAKKRKAVKAKPKSTGGSKHNTRHPPTTRKRRKMPK